jgi:hypothetical protein
MKPARWILLACGLWLLTGAVQAADYCWEVAGIRLLGQ